MKTLVFIDHDIICRHFILNGALSDLVERANVLFVFPDDGSKRVKLRPEDLPLGAPFVRLPINAQRQQTWRWLLYADQLRPRRGRHEAAIRRLRWNTLGRKAATLLTLGGLPFGAQALHVLAARRFAQNPNEEMAALIDRERPDVIFHPTVLDGVFVNDLVTEGQRTGVPVVFAMNSWDNPSTKRAVVGLPNKLLVWGRQTRDHAVRFIGMDRDDVVSFGAAQFDVFAGPPRLDRAAFCAAQGLDKNRSIVLFAGSNAQTDEVAALDILDEAIERGRCGPISILYRPHPWGGGGLGGERLAGRKWRHVVVDKAMGAYLEGLAVGGPAMTLPDYRDTHDILCNVDAVVSPLSTICSKPFCTGSRLPPSCRKAHRISPRRCFRCCTSSSSLPSTTSLLPVGWRPSSARCRAWSRLRGDVAASDCGRRPTFSCSRSSGHGGNAWSVCLAILLGGRSGLWLRSSR